MNQDFDTNTYIYVDGALECPFSDTFPYELTSQQYANALAKTAAHEGGHTLGLVHTAQSGQSGGGPGSTAEVQTITLSGGTTSSTFMLVFNGKTTAALARNATAAQVQTALRALATLGNNVSVAGAGGGPYTVTFNSLFSQIDLPSISGNGTNGLNVQVAETTKGVGASAISPQVASGSTDVMLGGDIGVKPDGTPRAQSFSAGKSQEGLKVGLHLGWTPADMVKLFNFHVAAMAAGGGAFFDVFGETDTEGPPIEGPHLFVLDSQGQIVFDTFDFSTVGVDGAGGQTSSTAFTLFSVGSEDLVLNSVRLTDDTGAYVGSAIADGTTLAPGESVQLDLTFDPLGSGQLGETLSIDSNDPVAQTEIAITGFGLSPDGDIRAEVPNNNVGGQALSAGPTTVVDFATVENIGATELTIADVAVSEGFGQYEPTGLPTLPVTLQPGESFSFDLDFDPTAIGLQRGIIQITSDDPGTPNLNLSAIGVGLADEGTALDYGNDFVAVETPFVPGSPVLRTASDDEGNWQFFLPSDQPFHSVICDPISGLCAHNYDVSASSGQPTVIPAPEFLPPVSVDTDGDGLTDDWEFAVGTRADKSDTDGDGLSDFVEVMAGLDPLGGLAFPTGIIATLDLVGEAKEVVVEQVTDNGTTQIAYVATGSDGLSIVDASKFDEPILLSRLALAGDNADVAVDTSLGIAAVTGGSSGLHLVDVSNTMAPSLIRTVTLDDGAARVEIFEGIAYVASGRKLVSVDLLTGEVVQILELGGSILTDVVREGTMLYTMDLSRTLRAVDISDFDILQRGSLGMTFGAGRLFAGNGIVYATAQTFFRGGFSTVDVTDPDNLALISDSDVTTQAPKADFKANGSGLGLLVGIGSGGGTDVTVMSVLDPAETDVFLTGFQLPAEAISVFIANGIAFVADGTAGLQVVNYLGFDNQGVPPVVTLSSAIPDLDPGAPGVQITEGTSVSVKIAVTDDFQVRSVDLIVNGEIVGTDVSFPFDPFAIAVSEGSTVEVRARATDTGGNSALSNTLVFDLVPDTFAPVIETITPGDGQEWAEGLSAVQVRFNEAIDADTVNALNFQLKDSVGTVIAPLAIALGNRDRAVLITYAPQPPGSYSVVIVASEVTDRAGNALGVDDIVSQFTLVEATVFWVGSSGFWDDTAHWNTGVVPGPADQVFIGSVVGNITVTYRSGTNSVTSINSHENFVMTGGNLALSDASTFQDLTLSCCTLSGSGDITVRDTFTWTGGTLDGLGAINIGPSAKMDIRGSTKTLRGRTINNAGTATWTSGYIGTGLGAVFNNTGTFDAQVNSNTFDYSQGGTVTIFNNSGSFRRTAGADTATIDVIFNNSGSVQAQSGTLNLTRGGDSSGSFEATSTGTLGFGGGTHNLDGSSSVFGDGTVKVTSGTANFGGAYNVTGGDTTTITGGTANFNADATTAALTLSGGTLAGTGSITVTSLFTWTGGTMAGTGSTDIDGDANIAGGSKWLTGRTVNFAGNTTWTASGNINTGQGATVNNLPGAVFDIQVTNSRGITFNQGNPETVFNNQGTVKKTVDTGLAFINVVFNNSGLVQSQAGTPDLERGGASSGDFEAAAPGILRFDGGTHTLDADSSVFGSGTVQVSNGTVNFGGTHNVTGTTSVTGGTAANFNAVATTNNLTLSGGSLSGTGSNTATGLFTWTGGTMAGTGSTNADGDANIAGGSKWLVSRTVNFAGNTTWTASGNINTGIGATINNLPGAVFDIQLTNSRGITQNQGGSNTVFNNQGTVNKTVDTGLVFINIVFNNSGLVQSQAGTLDLERGGASSGDFEAVSPGILRFDGGTHTLDADSSVFGNGTVQVSNGTVNFGGTYNVTGTTTSITGGIADFQTNATTTHLVLSGGTLTGVGDVAVTTLFSWTGGTMAGTGSTNADGDANIAGGSKWLVSRTVNFAGITTWTASGSMNTGLGATINNLPGAVFDMQINNGRGIFFNQGGTRTVFNNQGTVQTTVDTGEVFIDAAFNNSSTVDADTGTLSLRGGGTHTGNFDVASIALVQFEGGTHTLDVGTTITGAGETQITSGTVTLATAAAGVDAITAEKMRLSGGTLNGAGDLHVVAGGTFTWTGGILDGPGDINIAATAALNLSGSTKTLKSRTLNLAGTTTWTGNNSMNTGLGATINNLPGAVFDMQINNGRGIFFNQGGTRTVFNNQGTVKRTVDTGEAFIDAVFNNSGGTVDADTGTLTLRGGGTHTGNFDVASIALLELDGGIHTMNTSTSITGAGATQLTSGTLTIAGAVAAESFKIAGGTLNGAGDLTVSGLLTWTGGTMSGSGKTTIEATSALNISGSTVNLNQRTLENHGTTTWTATGDIRTRDAALIVNTGTWDVRTDRDLVHVSGTQPTFDNDGLFTKTTTATTGVTVVSVFFDNAGGTITNTSSGTLSFTGGGVNLPP